MARKPSGSIYQTKSGQWKVALPVRLLDGTRKKITRNAKSKRHGQVILDEIKKEFGSPIAGRSRLSVDDLLDRWLRDEVKPNLGKGTYLSYQNIAKNHIRPHIGKLNLSDLTTAGVVKWLMTLNELEVGARTRQYALINLNRAMKHAVLLLLIKINPCSGVPYPKVKTPQKNPFSEIEVDKILKATRGTRWYALFQLAFSTGMRQGEMYGLRWKNVDFENRSLMIVQQAVESFGHMSINDPKTEKGIRAVAVNDETIKSLKDHLKIMVDEGKGKTDYVFTTQEGKLIRRTNFRKRYFKPLLERLEISHRGMHQTRHTAATLMLRRGVPIHVVSAMLGHATTSITYDSYAHIANSDLRLAADAMINMDRTALND